MKAGVVINPDALATVREDLYIAGERLENAKQTPEVRTARVRVEKAYNRLLELIREGSL